MMVSRQRIANQRIVVAVEVEINSGVVIRADVVCQAVSVRIAQKDSFMVV